MQDNSHVLLRAQQDAVRTNPSKAMALKHALTLAAMSLGFGVVQLDVTIVNTALHAIGSAFGGGVSELQWVVNTYTIAFASFILTAGALGDRLGAKRVYMAGFAIFTLSSLGCALAPSAGLLIAARACQGLGAAILVPNSLALLNHSFPEEKERAWAVGIWAAGASFALTAGPFAGGALIAAAGWRSIFLVNLPIGLAGLWLTWRYAAETPPRRGRKLDLIGQTLAIVSLGSLAGAIIEAGVLGLSHPFVIAAFALSALTALLFVLREARTVDPMLELSPFRHRMFGLMALIGLLVNIAFYGLIFVLSLYFQTIEGWSAFETGLAFVPMMGIVLPANLMASRAAGRFGVSVAIGAGAIISAAGCAGLLFLSRNTPYWALAFQLAAIGGGLGLLVPPLTSTLLGSVEKSRSGIAAGVLNATRQTGSVIGVALFGAIVARPHMFMAGMRDILLISIGLMLASAAAVFSQRANRTPGASNSG